MKIAVVDIETNGLDPAVDSIFQVRIVLLNTETGSREKILDITCKEPNRAISKEAWVFKNSRLKYEDVMNANEFKEYKAELQKIFDEYPATAYNSRFDFTFLESRGILIKKKLEDPMLLLTQLLKLPFPPKKTSNVKKTHYQTKPPQEYKYPSVPESWNYLFPNQPIIEPHIAVEDADLEAQILYKLKDIIPNLFSSQKCRCE